MPHAKSDAARTELNMTFRIIKKKNQKPHLILPIFLLKLSSLFTNSDITKSILLNNTLGLQRCSAPIKKMKLKNYIPLQSLNCISSLFRLQRIYRFIYYIADFFVIPTCLFYYDAITSTFNVTNLLYMETPFKLNLFRCMILIYIETLP